MGKKRNASSLISELKRKTRKAYNSEEKIRIVIEGIRGELSIAELCRREGIHQANYYKWSKDFMEAGKHRLNGDTMREVNTSEVQGLKGENASLKELVADLSLEVRDLKKKHWLTRVKRKKYMHYSQNEKMEIIRLVEQSDLGVIRTLRQLKVNKTKNFV
jgi:transposase